jgi:hypothetical protein
VKVFSKEMEDYIIESEYGMQDMVITDPNTRIHTTGNDILKKLYRNQGYTFENFWETEQDRYFQGVLLERSYAAVLRGDFNTADIYLAMNYWNPELIDNVAIKAEEACLAGDHGLELMLTRICEYSKQEGFQCKALYFALWKKHIGLLEYTLAKINPINFTPSDLRAANIQGLGKYICKKDPARFYMKKQYLDGKLSETLIVRSIEEEKEYLLNKEAKYTGLVIHKYAKKTTDNFIITRMPTEVLRYMLSMI